MRLGDFAFIVEETNNILNSFAWGEGMLVLLLGTGVFLSVKTGFVQIKRFAFMVKCTVGSLFSAKNGGDKTNISPFRAVTTALAGTVGTGNIAGVTGALFAGGAGAVFWMWVSAFFGMCTKYAEILLAVKFRHTNENGRYSGGPMYYITKGLGKNMRWLACVFAIFGAAASFGIGNIAQSAEIAGAASSLFGVKPVFVGILLAVAVSFVIIGGIGRIGAVTVYLVPFMAAFYILACTVAIALRVDEVPIALEKIFREAFSFKSACGGALGCGIAHAVRQGVSRGVFSNEAGLGSAPMAHAASSAKEPVEQALWGVFEVFADTIVICTVTALVIMLSGVLNAKGGMDTFGSGTEAAAFAFDTLLPGKIGGKVIKISVLLFAFSSILGWSHYGISCIDFITEGSGTARVLYKAAFALSCIAGAAGSGKLMWEISDTLNGLMALPNLAALIFLSGIVKKETKKYFDKHDFNKLKKE